MNLNHLEQLQDCCRDAEAFEQMKHILTVAESFHFRYQPILFHLVSNIRESLSLTTLLTITTQEVQQALSADRVGIFRFDPDAQGKAGEFIAESVLAGFHTALATEIRDDCFGQHHATSYQNGKVQVIADVYNAGLQECYVEMLRQFQIRAHLVIPLRQGNTLWGLFCIHQCSAPRDWQVNEIEFAQQVAVHLEIAIQQAGLLEKVQQQSVELKQAMQELEKNHAQLIQNEKMASLGQLVAGIAHEINNPVNFIHGNLSHAQQHANDLLELLGVYRCQESQAVPHRKAESEAEIDVEFLMEDFPKILASMQLGTERIRQLVLSLRNFSRSDETMSLIDIHEGIENTLLILQHRLKPSSTSLGIRIAKDYADLPRVQCYASQLNQVFLNILGNAIDALEDAPSGADSAQQRAEAGTITIRTGLMPDPQGNTPRVIIRIADNGFGIPARFQDKLFDPFFTTKPMDKGTGLGLSISHQIIVEHHKGSLECFSQPGEGTEFWIELPVQHLQAQDSTIACTIEA